MFSNRTLERWANAVVAQFKSCCGTKNKDETNTKDKEEQQLAIQSAGLILIVIKLKDYF
jgi:hypothetical protein